LLTFSVTSDLNQLCMSELSQAKDLVFENNVYNIHIVVGISSQCNTAAVCHAILVSALSYAVVDDSSSSLRTNGISLISAD